MKSPHNENAHLRPHWLGMAYQQNSLDISHLQAVALGGHDTAVVTGGPDSFGRRGVQEPTPSSLQTRATTTTKDFAKRASQTEGTTANTKRCNVTHYRNLNDPGPSASRARMYSNSTPSDGDTQVAEDWVDYGEKEKRSTRLSLTHNNEEDTGYINIIKDFVQDHPAEAESGPPHDEIAHDDDDENDNEPGEPVDLVSQDVRAEDVRAEPFPESRRFQQPMTPLITGAKRKRPSEDKTPLYSTPKLPTNPFAGLTTTDMMRPSQIFQATQAQTSPLFVHSDSVSERPSPNVDQFGRPSTAGSLSSPVARRNPRIMVNRAVTEPQSNYIPMKESQEAREQSRQRTWARAPDPFDDDFEQQHHTQPSYGFQLERESMNIREQNSIKKLPSTSNYHQDAKGRATLLHSRSSEEPVNPQSPEVVLILDTSPTQEVLGNITEDETEREEEKEDSLIDDEIDELAEDNKENVEVPRTVSRRHQGQKVVSQSSPSRNRFRSRLKRSERNPATQVVRSPRRTRSRSREPMFDGSTQSCAVRDSQPSQQKYSSRRPAPDQNHSPPEYPQVVPQSQISQHSKSSVPESSFPSKAGANTNVMNITPKLSSPLNGSQRKMMGDSSTRTEDHDDYNKSSHGSNPLLNADLHRTTPSDYTDRSLSTTKSQSNEKTDIQKPASIKSTIPETNSAALANSSSPRMVPNSSQDISSSLPIGSSTSKLVRDPSLSEISNGNTLFETAQDCISTETSENRTKDSRSRQRGTAASTLKHFRHHSLLEITNAPSIPNTEIEINIPGLLIDKDNEMLYETVEKPIRSRDSHITQEDKNSDKSSDRRVEVAAKHKSQLIMSSTKWKSSISHPPLENPGSPLRPTSSAISQPTQMALSFEDSLSSSSGLSTPPAYDDEEDRLPSVVSPNAPVARGSHAGHSNEELISTSSSLIPKPAREIRTRNTSAYQENRPLQEAQLQLMRSREIQTIAGFSPELPIVAPDRVLAHFNGKSSAFYAATCLGVIPGDEPRYSVHYDDGAEDCISAFGIKRLEFRPGDVVKVDLPEHRIQNYVVVGMIEQQQVEDPKALAHLRRNSPDDIKAWPQTDIYGHSKVLLVPKRVSSVAIEQGNREQIVVGMYDLYLTQAMWTNIKDRDYIHADHELRGIEDSRVPAGRPSASSSPSSRLKRMKAASLIQSANTSGPKQGLFNNMAFTLTNISQPTELERAKSLILAQGGRVLEDGFDVLFHVPVLHRITSPKKSDSDRDFHPTREAQRLGFTCLIAEKHCRRAKYIQALALGIPCLATRWISDCVKKQRILPWSAYLLPAGESTFLRGATHSRVLPACPAENTPLSKLFSQRPCMLTGSSILLIMSKNEEESMRQYPLLTYALNPARVARALSIEAAAKAIAEAQAVGKPWDWVFSYDREQEVEKVLFGSTTKKKRTSVWHGGQESGTRVIGNEFLIQSLISGQLIE